MGFKESNNNNSEASSSSHTLILPNETTPLIKKSHKSSHFKTFANVFIAIVGAGVLGLPYTFKKTGYATGTITVFAVAYFTNHCMMLLVKTRKKMESKNGFSKINSFGDLGFVVAGPVGRTSVDVMIVLSQAGFCVSYLIFVSNTLVNIFNLKPLSSSVGNDGSSTIFGLSWKSFYIWACFPFQLGLNSIPTLTHLAPLSIFADVVDIGAMGVVMVEEVMIYLNTRPVLEAFGGFSVFFYGIGVAVYAFEGIGMVLPLESEMEKKEKFGSVLGITISFIALMFASFGVFGYFAFGDETKDIITTNLGQGWLSGLVQLGLCFNLFVTFPVMMNPVFEVFERMFCEGIYTLWVRWGMVLVVSLVALLVPNFADFLSLVGSSVCIVLGFVLPALFHLMVCNDEVGMLGWLKDGAFIVFGVLLAITGTWTSLLEILATKA